MIEKGILDGDLIFVRRQPTANAGQLVVALIDGEATVKTYRPARDYIALEPANSAFEPIIIPRGTPAEIIGIVTGVFRRC
jgi:repressor LexA